MWGLSENSVFNGINASQVFESATNVVETHFLQSRELYSQQWNQEENVKRLCFENSLILEYF